VSVAEYANERKVPSIAITDSVLSPIAQRGSIVLCARSELQSFTESLAAPVSLANALVTAVALSHRGRSLATLGRLEKEWGRAGLYHSSEPRRGSRLPLGG